ncbi:helix-turn-helix transcriptional regulator [Candidatus Accumulibacter sp. ACC005]|uniref:helix-turn-helix domain-containing protein n=1 Tax=Candidatus Accumulibacter sp. ACC005 TaxID=2823331 RepID=UPI0025BE0ADE|nr:helix-turn-helix transcriptional regulator [Candidatus Accumulibacter sp. ACC005]
MADAGGVGQQLRSAREARNITLAEAAQSLKLAPRQVAAIESEDWASLPGNTMIRGFVRNYARVLNLDADALMRALDATRMQRTLQLEASAGTSSHLPQASNQAERRDYLAGHRGAGAAGPGTAGVFLCSAELLARAVGGAHG